jgi:hypothetical protein
MKAHIYRASLVGVLVLCASTLGVALVSASTTISTNIDTGGNLSVTGDAAIGNYATVDGDLSEDGALGPSALTIGRQFTGTAASLSSNGVNILNLSDPAEDGWFAYGSISAGASKAGNTHAFHDIAGSYQIAIHAGSGTVTSLYGTQPIADNIGTGHITDAYGVWAQVFNESTGIIDNAYGSWSGLATNSGTINTYHAYHAAAGRGTLANEVGFWADDFAGSATNPYYSWFDSRGVRRVKEDSTFNGVGQAIEALYNPLFTKNTPGASDYERIILGEWNSNTAQIGTENSGSGSARPLALITAGTARMTIGASGSIGIATTSPVANLQVANGSNATTTMEVGSSGQNKGSCLKLYRTDGSAIYAYIAAGATTFTLTTTACASVSNF